MPQPEISAGSTFAKYAGGSPENGQTADKVAHILREAIFDGALQPSSWLRESELARQLGVSRTPVREALKRLAAEGLVDITARQGAMVSRMGVEDILEVYVVRENLEGLAARLAARHRSQAHLDQLEDVLSLMARNAEGPPKDLADLNLVFHKIIRQAAANGHLNRFLSQVEYAVRRFGRTTLEVPGRAEEAVEEHRYIVEAVAAGDAEAAERLAIEHMRRARELRIKMLIE
jgi:DNA-binding GntR family transcriptional regulator